MWSLFITAASLLTCRPNVHVNPRRALLYTDSSGMLRVYVKLLFIGLLRPMRTYSYLRKNTRLQITTQELDATYCFGTTNTHRTPAPLINTITRPVTKLTQALLWKSVIHNHSILFSVNVELALDVSSSSCTSPSTGKMRMSSAV